MKKIITINLLLFWALSQFLIAQVPEKMSYQGVLTDEAENLLTGPYTLTFKMYTSPSEGSCIWQETHKTELTKGMFNVILGSINPLKLPFNKPYWLGITVNESSELSPRISLTSSPYSLHAQTVTDSSITSKKISDGQLVRSVNSLTDELSIIAGKNIIIDQEGDSLIISAVSSSGNKSNKSVSGGDDTECYVVYSLNGLSGNLKLKTTGGAKIWDNGTDKITIKAGTGNIEEITNTGNSLDITDPTGKITNINIKDGGITEVKLADGAVTTPKLAADAVTSEKIADNTIITNDLADNSVSREKIQDLAISNSKLADSCITTIKLDTSSVGTDQLVDGAVTTDKISDNAVTTVKIPDQHITTTKIANNSVTSDKLAANSVTTLKINGNAITNAKIANGTVITEDLANNAVTTDKIIDGAVTQAKIGPGVTLPPGGTAGGDLVGNYPNPSIAANAVTSTKIASGQVVKSLNTLKDDVTLAAGPNVTITPSGNTLTLSAAGPDNDWTFAGNNIYSGVSGNVGIGTTNPGYKFQVSTDGSRAGYFTSNMPSSSTRVLHAEYNGPSAGYYNPIAVYGRSVPEDGRGYGGYFQGGYYGLYASVRPTGSRYYYGLYSNVYGGSGTNIGLNSYVRGSRTNYGLRLSTYGLSGASSNYGMYSSTSGYGRYNYGIRTSVSGRSGSYSNYGISTSTSGYSGSYYNFGLYATTTGYSRYNYGLYARTSGSSGSRTNYGIYALTYGRSGSRNYGLYASTTGYSGSYYNYGVYARAYGGSRSYAGYFAGDLYAYSANSSIKAFKIDHPLDPENKYLYHSSVESPDMMNIYNGNVTLDYKGEAWVQLPNYFESLNDDFRYQLTCIGGFAQVYIAEKIKNNRFKIAGGTSGLEVSWQITGIRKDAVAKTNRIQVEQDKPDFERGKYLNPEAYGLDETMGIDYDNKPDKEEEINEQMNEEEFNDPLDKEVFNEPENQN